MTRWDGVEAYVGHGIRFLTQTPPVFQRDDAVVHTEKKIDSPSCLAKC